MDELEDAMEMLGKGYEPVSVLIESPRTVTGRRDGRMVEIEEPAWVKFSTEFKNELKTLDVYSLKVFLYIGLCVNWQTGTSYPGTRNIAEETGMDKDTVTKAIENLESLNFLQVTRAAGKPNVYEPVRFISIGTVRPEGTPRTPTVPPKAVTVPPKAPTVPRSRGDSAQLEELEVTRDSALDFKSMTVIQAYKLPTLKLYQEAVEYFPGSPAWEFVHNTILEHNLTFKQLHDASEAWAIAGFKQANIKGLLEWAVNGVPEKYRIKITPKKTDEERPEYRHFQPDPNEANFVPAPPRRKS